MAKQNPINTPSKRNRLESCGEPYWHKISKGRFIGYRKTTTGGTWIARSGKTQQRFADGSEMDYDAALKFTIDWCDRLDGGASHRYALRQCVDDYVSHLETRKTATTAKAEKQRLEYNVPVGLMRVELNKLTTRQIKGWHGGLVRQGDSETVRRSKDTANRALSTLKAALNTAYRDGLVSSDAAWKRVEPFKNVAIARDLFLTDQQVSDLLEHTDGAFYDLCRAAVLTGARVGELTSTVVSDLDLQTGILRLDGKTGPRQCYLSDAGITYFKRLSKDKLPQALILPNRAGGKWRKENWRDEMRRTKKRAKLPADTVMYSLRHYAISKLLLAGVAVQVIAENTGTSVGMFEKHYGKFMPSDRRAMLSRAEILL